MAIDQKQIIIQLKKFFCFSLLCVMLASCQSGTDADSESNSKDSISTDIIDNPEGQAKEKGRLPGFEFAKTTHDFGEVKEGEKAAYTFTFTNSGEKPLVISSANPSCGCTVPNYPKDPVKPGEKGKIDVVFDSEGKSGQFNKSITLMANTPGDPKKLFIKGQVIKK